MPRPHALDCAEYAMPSARKKDNISNPKRARTLITQTGRGILHRTIIMKTKELLEMNALEILTEILKLEKLGTRYRSPMNDLVLQFHKLTGRHASTLLMELGL